MFLNECKYIENENKEIRYITEDLKFSSDDSNESNKKQIKINFPFKRKGRP